MQPGPASIRTSKPVFIRKPHCSLPLVGGAGGVQHWTKIFEISNIEQGISNRGSDGKTSKFDIPCSVFCGVKTIHNFNMLQT
jgi:hypothetical protein